MKTSHTTVSKINSFQGSKEYRRERGTGRTMTIVLSCFLGALFLGAKDSGESKLLQAREMLRGEHKDAVRAKQLLLDIVNSDNKTLDPPSLCYAYVYLGYIDDRDGKREEAKAWYKKALEIKDADPVQECAKEGLEKPLTFIRHLDEDASQPNRPNPPEKTLKIGKGYVTMSNPPTDLVTTKFLSLKERQENFDFICDAIDKTYACFDLKAIDWPDVRLRYQKQLDKVKSADDFYILVFHLVNELKDTHSWLNNYQPALLTSGPADLAVDMFDEKPYVISVKPNTEAARAGVKAGSEILEVDGLNVAEKVEQLRSCLPACSSQRAFMHEAYRYLLAGNEGSKVTIKLRWPDGGIKMVALKRTVGLKRNGGIGARAALTCPFELTRQKFVHFARHPSGLGYIWIESFNGREEIADEFDRAITELRDTPGLILDIHDNSGGYGNAQPRIVGRYLQDRTLVSIDYIKNGPGHKDLRREERFFEPKNGDWQYTKPVALLVNVVTGSATDLFACYMRSTGRVTTIGTTTHGNLSGVGAYAVLPCGLVVRISNGYICDDKNMPIECNGNKPDVTVSPSISDFLKGKDPALDKAVALLSKKTSAK